MILIIFILFQEKQRSTFFSIFYLSINAGSLLSTLITPILRCVYFFVLHLLLHFSWCIGNTHMNNLSCLCVYLLCFSAQECGIYSKQSCFPLAFGVPAALMVVALGKDLIYSYLCWHVQYHLWPLDGSINRLRLFSFSVQLCSSQAIACTLWNPPRATSYYESWIAL